LRVECTAPSLSIVLSSRDVTIKGYDEEFAIYRLGFPNREVEEGFIKYLMPFYTNVDKVEPESGSRSG